jgi:hypothetical protein
MIHVYQDTRPSEHKMAHTTGYLNQMRFSWVYLFLHGRVLKKLNLIQLKKAVCLLSNHVLGYCL